MCLRTSDKMKISPNGNCPPPPPPHPTEISATALGQLILSLGQLILSLGLVNFILGPVNFIFGPVNFIFGPVNFIFGPVNFIFGPVNFIFGQFILSLQGAPFTVLEHLEYCSGIMCNGVHTVFWKSVYLWAS